MTKYGYEGGAMLIEYADLRDEQGGEKEGGGEREEERRREREKEGERKGGGERRNTGVHNSNETSLV